MESQIAANETLKKVSVIVPVYNVEQFLPQCLESIVSQSYAHLEILLVDDGSTDSSGRICDEHAARDRRITVIHRPNGGPGAARNAALDRMTGDRVVMVDGDDWMQPDAIEWLCRLMDDTGADIVACGWREVYPDTKPEMTHPTPPGTSHRLDTKSALEHIFYQKRITPGIHAGHLTHSPWGRMYRSELFDNIRYPEGVIYEDLAIAFDLYGRCRLTVFTESRLYNYLQRPTSFMGHFSESRTQVIAIMEALERRVGHERPDLLPAVQSRLLSAYFNILLLCPSDDRWRDITDHCWAGIKRLRRKCLTDPQVRPKNKAGIAASWLGRRGFLSIFSRFMNR